VAATPAPDASPAAAQARDALLRLLADAKVSDQEFAQSSKYVRAGGLLGGPLGSLMFSPWEILPLGILWTIGMVFRQPFLGFGAGVVLVLAAPRLMPSAWRRYCRRFASFRLWQASRGRADWPRLAWLAQQLLQAGASGMHQVALAKFVASATRGQPAGGPNAHLYFWAWLSERACGALPPP